MLSQVLSRWSSECFWASDEDHTTAVGGRSGRRDASLMNPRFSNLLRGSSEFTILAIPLAFVASILFFLSLLNDVSAFATASHWQKGTSRKNPSTLFNWSYAHMFLLDMWVWLPQFNGLAEAVWQSYQICTTRNPTGSSNMCLQSTESCRFLASQAACMEHCLSVDWPQPLPLRKDGLLL